MKFTNYTFWIILIFIMALLCIASPTTEKTLADLYKTGTIHLVPELSLDEDSLPDDVFLESPIDLAIDSEGNLYVCDYQAHDIKVFNSSGKFLNRIGRQGQGPGEFNMPFNLALTKERLIVWEISNRRFSVFSNKGGYLKSIQVQMSDGMPRKLRALPNGDFVIEKYKMFFGDNEKPQECLIEIFSPNLEFKETVYSRDTWENKYITKPHRTNVPMPFSPTVHWDVSPDGKIITGYSETFLLEIYDGQGSKISQFEHKYNPVKVTSEDKEKFFSGITSRSSSGETIQGAPDFIKKNTKFPKFKPAFYNFMIDSEGNILVFCHQKDNTADYRLFSAFDPGGTFINDVRIENAESLRFSFYRACFWGKNFWIIEFTPDEIAIVRKYKISEGSAGKTV